MKASGRLSEIGQNGNPCLRRVAVVLLSLAACFLMAAPAATASTRLVPSGPAPALASPQVEPIGGGGFPSCNGDVSLQSVQFKFGDQLSFKVVSVDRTGVMEWGAQVIGGDASLSGSRNVTAGGNGASAVQQLQPIESSQTAEVLVTIRKSLNGSVICGASFSLLAGDFSV